jgi:hypothetical protein
MSFRKTFSAFQTPKVLTSESSSRGNPEREPFFSSSRPYLSSSESNETEDQGEQPVLASEARVWFSKQTLLLGSVIHRTADVINNNAGLMLVAASQAFFAMMNVAVKKLNGLDPPVPVFEVRMYNPASVNEHNLNVAGCCTHGEAYKFPFTSEFT